MSLKDLVNGVEAKIDSIGHRETIDPATLRDPVLRSITHAETQWGDRNAIAHPDWFSESNGTVAFSPTLANGAPLTIDGLTTNFIPAERFPAYLGAMRSAVEAGVFDAEIVAGTSGSPNVSGLATVAVPEHHGTDRLPSETAGRD